jgi:hypothetical protein
MELRKLLAFFMLASASFAQAPKKPQSHPESLLTTRPQWSYGMPSGVWAAPETFLDTFEASLFGKLVWKHCHIEYPALQGRLVYFHVENLTHPLRFWDSEQKRYVTDFSHDPRNVILLRTSLDFDAVAGDEIQWQVWSQ